MIAACIFMTASDVDGLTHTKQLLNLLCIVYVYVPMLVSIKIELVHGIMVLNVYEQKNHLNDYTDVFSKARGLNISLSLQHHPYFMYACIEASGESEQLRRLSRAFVARLKCDKHQNIMC